MRQRGKLILILVLLCTGVQASAKPLFFIEWPCENGARSYSSGFRDDDTGLQYMLYVDCYGNTCLYPLIGPYPRAVSTSEWGAPPDLHDRLDAARNLTDPGADVGVYMVRVDTGDTLRFRNPIDGEERHRYLSMWLHEQEATGQIAGNPFSVWDISEALIQTYREQYARMSKEEHIVANLIDEYWNARYKEGEHPEGHAEMDEITTVVAELAHAKSNIRVKQTPSNATDYQLVLVPVTPLLLGQVTLYNAAGQAVWSGELQSETTIPMNTMPSGMYFIRSRGMDIPLLLVR